MSLLSATNHAKRMVETAKEDVIRKILALPQNPDVVSLTDKCFVLKSSAISTVLKSNMDPTFYDFKASYRAVSDLICKTTFPNVVGAIRTVLDTGYVGKQKLHPEAVRNLKTVLEEEIGYEER